MRCRAPSDSRSRSRSRPSISSQLEETYAHLRKESPRESDSTGMDQTASEAICEGETHHEAHPPATSHSRSSQKPPRSSCARPESTLSRCSHPESDSAPTSAVPLAVSTSGRRPYPNEARPNLWKESVGGSWRESEGSEGIRGNQRESEGTLPNEARHLVSSKSGVASLSRTTTWSAPTASPAASPTCIVTRARHTVKSGPRLPSPPSKAP